MPPAGILGGGARIVTAHQGNRSLAAAGETAAREGYSTAPLSGGSRAPLALVALLPLTLLSLDTRVARAPVARTNGAWTQYRGDPALTGRSRVRGAITAPAVLWKRFIGARETLLRVRPDEQSKHSSVPLSARDHAPERAAPVATAWGLSGTLHDLDGRGAATPAVASGTTRIARLLPEEPLPQLVEFESAFGKPEGAAAVGRLKVRRDGQWLPRWETEPIPLLYSPNPIAGDFDGDGRMEIAVTPWYDLWVLDAATGRVEAKERFMPPGAESGRAYGWVGAADLDADGRQEFIVLGDFENFMAVLGWRDGKLARLWHRLIERGITRKETILRPGAAPVQDVDGDGRPEIVVSLYNARRDGRWHVEVLEGMTGRVQADLPDRLLSGLRDMDGDSVAELFLTRTSGSLPPERADLEVLGLKGGRRASRLKVAGAAFATAPLSDFPLHVSSGASTGRTTLLAGALRPGGPLTLFTRRRPDKWGQVELTAWSVENGRVRQVATMTGPHLDTLAVRAGGGEESGLLLRATVPGDEPRRLTLSGAVASPLVSRRVGAPLSPVVGGRLRPGAEPVVVVQGAAEEVWALEVPSLRVLASRAHRDGSGETKPVAESGDNGRPPTWERRPPGGIRSQQDAGAPRFDPASSLGAPALPGVAAPTVRWRRAAHGMFTGAGTLGGGVPWGGLLLTDLAGDGTLSTLAATRAPEGHARLVALAPDGRERWQRDFPAFPGAPPEWNIGGLTMWFAGRFRDARRNDVLVSLRRSTMHSDESVLLDGRTGAEVWKRTEGVLAGSLRRGYGGAWTAVYDHDGNGLDDAATLYPDGVFVVEGATGRPLLDLDTNRKLFPDVWSFYATPVAGDFLGNGGRQLLYAGNHYMLGLLDRGGRVQWSDRPFSGSPPVLPGVGDVDGDGRLELLFPGWARERGATEAELRCLDAATGRVEWRLSMPGGAFGPLGELRQPAPLSPSVADLDGDGREECLVPVANSLYAFAGAPGGKAGEMKWQLKLPATIGPVAVVEAGGRGGIQLVVACADGYVYGLGSAS